MGFNVGWVRVARLEASSGILRTR